MKIGNWFFLVLAFLAAACMVMTGVAVGFRSVLGIVLSIVGLIIVMGFGFVMKKKMSERNGS
ncbi:YlaF family protein [Metabacillus arenae]|uniref:YlaF family protein n=1 Tax=Metabacillus arenae TaxID=2771434 RepID=A0A926NH20_9BACI|nr:YlaF family protein [Metabacillus arenae]MBD1380935.1 YlaF family protein [Metabacillus arenae]